MQKTEKLQTSEMMPIIKNLTESTSYASQMSSYIDSVSRSDQKVGLVLKSDFFSGTGILANSLEMFENNQYLHLHDNQICLLHDHFVFQI